MGREPETNAGGWTAADHDGGPSLSPEERSLAGQLIALGKADQPEAGFVAGLGAQLSQKAEEDGRPGGERPPRVHWAGMQHAGGWALGLAGLALLAGVLVLSIGLLPRGSMGPDATAGTAVASPMPELNPTLSPTPEPGETAQPALENPLPAFPLEVGTRWVYTYIPYEPLPSHPTQVVTATYTLTETVIGVKSAPPYFAAQIETERALVSAPPQWPGGDLSGRGFTWYVIHENRVYEGSQEPDLAAFDPERAPGWRLAYRFPLSVGQSWCPVKYDLKSPEPKEIEDCRSLGEREVVQAMAYESALGEFDDCYQITESITSGGTTRWFCSQVGLVAARYDHAGTRFGFEQTLVEFTAGSVQTSVTEAPPTPVPTLPPGSAFAVVSQDQEREILVRGGPGSVYHWIDRLQPGARAALLGRSHQGDWLQVEAPEAEEGSGWVFYNQVAVESPLGEATIQALPVTSPLALPAPDKPALSQSACASPARPPAGPPLAPELSERPGLLIGGDTLQVGGFTFDLWLHCDSVFGTSGGYLDAQSEIAGLGLYASWTYHGPAQKGEGQTLTGIEPYVRLHGVPGNLEDGYGGGVNQGLQFPLGVIPDFSGVDTVPLRFVYAIQTPDGEALGAVLAFTLERRADGFYPAQVSVTPWQGDVSEWSGDADSAGPPLPLKEPAELYPLWDEASALLERWQASLLSGPGWIYLVNRRYEPETSNQLFGGRTEIISEQWYLLDSEGRVAASAHIDRGTDGTILQQSYVKDGRAVNLTFGMDDPAVPPYRLDLAAAYTQELLMALQLGQTLGRSETTIEGRQVIVYSWTETYATPLELNGERLVAANTRREIFDRESGAPLISELYETNPDGEERLVWKTAFEVAERVQTLPQEVQDLLGQEFQGYSPPAPEGTPAPEGFDPSQSELTLRTVPGDSFERPGFFYGDISAGGFLLGRVDFGASPGGYCDRSADGSRLAFNYLILPSETEAHEYLRWLDLRDVSQVYDPAPELELISKTSWAPQGSRLAFSACKTGRTACGLYLLEADTNQVRLLSEAGVGYAPPLWKPDGTQIAFVSSDANNDYTLFVVDAASGETVYSGRFDADAWQAAPGAPTLDWGVEIPRGYLENPCFANE